MEDARFEIRDLALSAVFASLYAAMVILQGISAAAVIQLRIADCLIPLSAIFGPPVIVGVSLGCFVSNAYFSASIPYGLYDIVFGPLANLIAAAIIFKFRRRIVLGCFFGAVTVGLIVGSYLWLLFPPPSNIFGLTLPAGWPPWALSMLSLTISSTVAFAVIGLALLKVMSRPNIINPLKSRGLKVYA